MALPPVLGAWGRPPDLTAWGALAAAGVAAVVACAPPRMARAWAERVGRRGFVVGAAFGAALLSLGYVAFYLRGAPRIIDATAYYLQAHALSEGHFAWRVPEPTASFRGRFTLFHDGALAGIFPPGYPLLLSLGFAVGAPLVVGPVLAAVCVVATSALARALAREAAFDDAEEAWAGRLAACLSLVCATLRYHTADTMAHGACAVAFALALLAALRARRDRLPWFFLLAGLALGFVLATRFASAIALGAVLAWLAWSDRCDRATALVACALGVVPGALLLLIAQTAATGDALRPTQLAYYAASDGPPGCFRYGFGSDVGCIVEHADFVRARLSDGYGVVAAIGVTARRLHLHLEDVANLEPLALLVLAPLLHARTRTTGARAALALVAAIVLAYAPFYFDGNYPGGGARHFADVLPVEHALVALGLLGLARGVSRLGPLVLSFACAGFAVHGAYRHEQLRDREGARTTFDAEVLSSARLGVTANGRRPMVPTLVLVDSDAAFDLAHDPEAIERAADDLASGKQPTGLFVARARGDDTDRLLYERLGRPQAWTYRPKAETPRTVADLTRPEEPVRASDLSLWTPTGTWAGGAETWRFEGENAWPPLVQVGGAWAEPVWMTDTCASPPGNGRALALHASRSGGEVTVAVPVPRAGSWVVTPRFAVGRSVTSPPADLRTASGELLASWAAGEGAAPSALAPRTGEIRCIDLPSRTVTAPDEHELRLVLSVPGQSPTLPHPPETALDRVILAAGSR